MTRLLPRNRVLRWTLICLIIISLLSVLALWSWGRFARSAQGEPSHALPVASAATTLDRLVQPLLDRHDDDSSGAAFLGDPELALKARVLTARKAERSLDVQYYIWSHDTTGQLLQHELMNAADRGVRVRMLIDDVNLAGRDDELLAMAAHPKVEIRLFNPARNRDSTIRRAVEMGLRFIGFNRRMHNKAWIADNRMAIVGGRNIADHYFGADDETNYRDTDLLLIGPAVAQTSSIFDEFWNSTEVIPLRALHEEGSRWSRAKLKRRRRQWLENARATDWVSAVDEHDDLQDKLLGDELVLHWSPSIRVLSDPPKKAAPLANQRDRAGWLMYDVMALLYSTKHRSWLISPYFVPGSNGTLLLAGQVRRAMTVRVLTNSLAATNVPMVHAGYARYRKQLLAQGVELYELKPGDDDPDRELIPSSRSTLHSKAFVIDGRRGFVGSFNLDPRSAQLNTEMGVMFDDPGLAQELTRYFRDSIRPENAWHVILTDDDELRWLGTKGFTWEQEPETGLGLRVLVRLLGLLPIESQL